MVRHPLKPTQSRTQSAGHPGHTPAGIVYCPCRPGSAMPQTVTEVSGEPNGCTGMGHSTAVEPGE